MKTLFLLIVGTFFADSAWALTRGQFLMNIGMVSITDRVMGNKVDDDPERLYAVMNVPPRNDSGKGKSIISKDGNFRVICALRSPTETTCTMVMKSSSRSKVLPREGIMRFVALGEESEEFRAQFVAPVDPDGVIYRSTDERMVIRSEANAFVAEFKN